MATTNQKDSLQQAGQAAKDQASAMWSGTKESARSMVTNQQQAAASGLGEFAGALRKAARDMGDGSSQAPMSRMVESAADGLERFSNKLREKDLDGMLRDVESFARQQPLAFFGAAVAAGFLAMRFMKATRSETDNTAMGASMPGATDRIDQQFPY